MKLSPDDFPTTIEGLPAALASGLFELEDGDRFALRVAPVAKHLGKDTVRMLAYNGSIPGPTLRVTQGSTLLVDVANDGDLETTVHWHGLRLANRYDGTPETQRPIPVGGRFTYRLDFPDPGLYWYHPHIREDYGQELGLYGAILVVPREDDYWPPVNRELILTLDDILLENRRIAPFSRRESTYTAMGRFGNLLLVNGEPEPSLSVRRGEVVRLYLTNTANTRVFNVRLPGARMKLVGGDSGHYEHEAFVDRVLVAPSERVVIDALFDQGTRLTLEHRTPKRTYTLATVTVTNEPATPSLAPEFSRLRTNADLTAERQRVIRYLDLEPDKTLALVAEMDLEAPESSTGATVAYVCPMHPEVTAAEPGRCPKCGMKLVPADLIRESAGGTHDHHQDHGDHEHHDHHRHEHRQGEGHPHHHAGDEHDHDEAGIEWEDDMVDLNRRTTPADMRWKLIDRATGAEGRAIDWRFKVGDRVKLRLVNETDSDHPMQHPFHLHGAGRFLILARNGVPEPNFVWKDTVLARTGETVDLLLDLTNPGLWMAHCHIAEHHEGGMMLTFTVEP